MNSSAARRWRVIAGVVLSLSLAIGTWWRVQFEFQKPSDTVQQEQSGSLQQQLVAEALKIADGDRSLEKLRQIAVIDADGNLTIDGILSLSSPPILRPEGLADSIRQHAQRRDATMLAESMRYIIGPELHDEIDQILAGLLEESPGKNSSQWLKVLWKQPPMDHPQYVEFKSRLYRRQDNRFEEYFNDSFQSSIRMDEIAWGGVRRDGIPPLTNPNTLSARQAEYLADSDVVFGVSINGDARCYPKRILAWHEMVRDTVGGVPINGVYCTLCGSMIVYDTRWNDRQFLLGTSGFLYRSNKLMYDRETKSLWSTICGRPVVGPLVEENISLNRLHVVTSTWGQWRQQHPDTRVLSLNTGHERDYGEGVAYRDYFATDDLMFDVPARDNR
ncbi:MAG: DUF3179 domain-containing (seleno)protein, partial [Planctomycetota bacterium]